MELGAEWCLLNALCPLLSILNERWAPARIGGLAHVELDHSLEYTAVLSTMYLSPVECILERGMVGLVQVTPLVPLRLKRGIFIC